MAAVNLPAGAERPAPFTILIVDDEREMCLSLSEILRSQGFEAITATDPRAVPALLARKRADLAIMDIRMPQLPGIDLLKALKHEQPSLPVIMITGFPSVENAVLSMRYGALNFFVKPLPIRELLQEIQQLAGSPARGGGGEERIVTRNPRMLGILEEVQRVGPADAAVLITGETGTGKELIASAVHARSGRRDRAFVKLNCASIPETLLESELFGHERGAYTDAAERHIGKLEAADRGTLFFDEIGDMTVRTQAKLLRVLQDGEFQRLGGQETLRTDVRVLAATNQDIDACSPKARPEDALPALGGANQVPALRERKDDLELLVGHFLERFNHRYGREVSGLSPEVQEIFQRHNWPGNVRELKNCVERAVIFCDGRTIAPEHLQAQYRRLGESGFPGQLEGARERLDREMIAEALARSQGEKQKAAALLHISRKTLYNRMKKLGMG
jgi:DNA-binding NtrC family response regulator